MKGVSSLNKDQLASHKYFAFRTQDRAICTTEERQASIYQRGSKQVREEMATRYTLLRRYFSTPGQCALNICPSGFLRGSFLSGAALIDPSQTRRHTQVGRNCNTIEVFHVSTATKLPLGGGQCVYNSPLYHS